MVGKLPTMVKTIYFFCGEIMENPIHILNIGSNGRDDLVEHILGPNILDVTDTYTEVDTCFPPGLNSKDYRLTIGSDVFDFFSKFNRYNTPKPTHVVISRFMEHIPETRILEFLFKLSEIMNHGAELYIIVPNYILLLYGLKELENDFKLDEYQNRYTVKEPKNFQLRNTILWTELVNCPDDPHASIWTEAKAVY